MTEWAGRRMTALTKVPLPSRSTASGEMRRPSHTRSGHPDRLVRISDAVEGSAASHRPHALECGLRNAILGCAALRSDDLPQHARDFLGRIGLVQQLEPMAALLGKHVAVARGEHHRQIG